MIIVPNDFHFIINKIASLNKKWRLNLMRNVKSLIEIFKSTISFLTIIPVKSNITTIEEFNKIILFFPLTGLILGVYYYICTFVAYQITNSTFFCTIIYTAMTVILTGGLHYDGLSDSFDGLFCGKDKDKTLEVMSDSRIGTFGVLGIVLNIMLKTGIIYLLIEENLLPFAIFSVIFARMMQVVFAYKSTYPKNDGMGNIFIGKIATSTMIWVLSSFIVISLLVTFIFLKYDFIIEVFIISTVLSFIVFLKVKKSIEQKIGGITGDILGLVAETSETTFLYIAYFTAKVIAFLISQ